MEPREGKLYRTEVFGQGWRLPGKTSRIRRGWVEEDDDDGDDEADKSSIIMWKENAIHMGVK